MVSVALTGGIGSGKSTVAEIFEELGALVIDFDQLSREVIERGTPGFDQVIARFGDVILKEGEIDRSALGGIVFADEKARRELESIIHPLLRERAEKITSRSGENRIVINQIPLLFETQGASRFQLVITVAASEELRRERLRERGMKDYEISRRLAAQATDEERASISDLIIENNGTLDELRRRVEEIWARELLPRVAR